MNFVLLDYFVLKNSILRVGGVGKPLPIYTLAESAFFGKIRCCFGHTECLLEMRLQNLSTYALFNGEKGRCSQIQKKKRFSICISITLITSDDQTHFYKNAQILLIVETFVMPLYWIVRGLRSKSYHVVHWSHRDQVYFVHLDKRFQMSRRYCIICT